MADKHPADIFETGVLSRHPGAVADYDTFVADRETLADKWPDWCGLPMAAAYAMLTKDAADPKSALGSGVDELPKLTAALLWRQSKIVYRFDRDVAEALAQQPLDGDLPRDALYHMPYYCVYVEYPSVFAHGRSRGFYAWMEWDVNNKMPELRLLYLMADGSSLSVPILLPGGTLEDSKQALRHSAIKRYDPAVDMGCDDGDYPSDEIITASINMVLYLSSEAPDIPGDGELRARRTYRGTVAKRTAVLDVGTRIGAALREAAASDPQSPPGGSHASPVAHIRRAHWHHFWIGSSDERKLIVRWLPPIPVNVTDEADPVVRPIK